MGARSIATLVARWAVLAAAGFVVGLLVAGALKTLSCPAPPPPPWTEPEVEELRDLGFEESAPAKKLDTPNAPAKKTAKVVVVAGGAVEWGPEAPPTNDAGEACAWVCGTSESSDSATLAPPETPAIASTCALAPQDLRGACKFDLVEGEAGQLAGRLLWSADARLWVNGRAVVVSRGPEVIEDPEIETLIGLTSARRLPGLLELRALVSSEREARLGSAWYRAGRRVGIAGDLDFDFDGRPESAAVGLSIRLGKK